MDVFEFVKKSKLNMSREEFLAYVRQEFTLFVSLFMRIWDGIKLTRYNEQQLQFLTTNDFYGLDKFIVECVRDYETLSGWRNRVFEINGSTCFNCSTTEKLTIHHLVSLERIISSIRKSGYRTVYDYFLQVVKHPLINNEDNAIVLCRTCHDKVELPAPLLGENNENRN